MTVCRLAEIPEELSDKVTSFLESNPTWDEARFFQASAALFLAQNNNDPIARQNYINALFPREVSA